MIKMKDIIGVQCFGMRKELEHNLRDSLQKIRDMGFDAIEPVVSVKRKSIFFKSKEWTVDTIPEFASFAEQMRLIIPSMHVNLGLFPKQIDEICEDIIKLSECTGTKNIVFSTMFSNEKSAKKWGLFLKKISQILKPYSIKVLYHNHDDEFNKIQVNGRELYALDYFLQYAGDDVYLQLDIGWAGFTEDEVKIVEKYKHRIMEIHCKDFYQEAKKYKKFHIPKDKFAAIGEGVIRTRQIIQMRGKLLNYNGVIIIDQDYSQTDIFHDFATGRQNLEAYLNE